METTVKERLKMFLKEKNIGQVKFATSVGLSRGFVNNIANSIQPKTLHRISMYYPELNISWLLTGEGEMLNATSTLQNEEMRPSEDGIPLIPANAMAGMLGGEGMSFMEYDCEHYLIPAFNGADFLIRVQGDSMMPKYLPGDIVACKKVVMDRLWFQWGKCYVADTRQGVLIKRVEPSKEDGCIEMNSENQSYKPFDLPVSEVNGLALVVGVLRVE